MRNQALHGTGYECLLVSPSLALALALALSLPSSSSSVSVSWLFWLSLSLSLSLSSWSSVPFPLPPPPPPPPPSSSSSSLSSLSWSPHLLLPQKPNHCPALSDSDLPLPYTSSTYVIPKNHHFIAYPKPEPESGNRGSGVHSGAVMSPALLLSQSDGAAFDAGHCEVPDHCTVH